MENPQIFNLEIAIPRPRIAQFRFFKVLGFEMKQHDIVWI